MGQYNGKIILEALLMTNLKTLNKQLMVVILLQVFLILLLVEKKLKQI